MGPGHSMPGFVVIVILYAVIGLMAAAGLILVARKILAPKAEQIFYAMFLITIAAFYLAFTAYFGVATAWRLETAVVGMFAVIGLVGARVPFFLIVGYLLHGIWDLLHELQAHGAYSAFEPGRLTAIPLAYGIFCLAFDFCVAAYFIGRQAGWNLLRPGRQGHGPLDSQMSYADSLVKNATEFFADGKTVFAMCGEGVCCHVADCTDETGAHTVAEALEKQRIAQANQEGSAAE